jgi:signal transduction histidine kinase
MRISEPLAQSILSDLQVIVAQADADLQVVAHTPGLEAYLLEPTEPSTGQPLTDLFPELFGSEEDLEAVAAGLSPRFELPMINRLDPEDGERRYVSLIAVPHPEIKDNLALLVQDVTTEGHLDQQVMQQLNEVRLLRSRLEAANQELTYLNEEKSAFLRMAAHDLRAPLTVIKGYVELVMEDTEAASDEEALEYLDVVMRRTQQMSDLIDNLLDVEKIESGAVDLDRKPVDVADLVAEVGRGFALVAQQRGMSLEWLVPADLPQPLADRARLVQVLNNLVSNAIKFTPEGGQIRIAVLPRERELAIEVSDTGPGISEKDQARLFQRFFRTDASRQQRIPGTGLGLSIVRAIAQQHGGQAYCRSQLGEGTTFGFTLSVQAA